MLATQNALLNLIFSLFFAVVVILFFVLDFLARGKTSKINQSMYVLINFVCMKTDEIKTEIHPLEPFFPQGARLLMMGSFPPKRERWKMDFYYPNFQK